LECNSRKAGYQILIGCSDDDPETEKNLVKALLSRRIDALFVASALPDGSDYYLKIQQQGTPIIALDRALDDEHFGCVISEDFDGAYELTGSVFEAQAKEQGITCTAIYGDHFNSESGKAVFKQWLKADKVPDAIIVTSYTMLEGILDVLIEQPALMKTVKLGTFGDNRLLDFLPIKINSLAQQFELIADSALALGLNASAKRYQAGLELIPRKIVIRK